MNVAEMRTFLGLPGSTSDAAVTQAYAAYLDASSAQEPLTLDEVKLNLRVSSTDEDALIEGLIVAARVHVETFTGLVLTPRVVTETAQQLGRWVDLASWPVTSITEIRYPLAGVMTAMATGAWVASYKRRPVRLLPITPGWGVAGGYGMTCRSALPIEIDVSAGYATPADVPAPVRQAMHLLVAHWYGNRAAAEVGARAAAIEVPLGVDALLSPYRLRVV